MLIATCGRSGPIDSLLQELDIAKNDRDKAYILNNLSRLYYLDTAEVQLNYALKAHEMYVNSDTKDDSLLMEIHYLKGSGYERVGKTNLSVESFMSSLEIAQRYGWKSMLARIHNYLGIVYDSLGSIDDAVKHYHKSLEFANEIEDNGLYMAGQNNIGHLYMRIREYDKAEERFLENLTKAKQYKYFEGTSITHTNLGIIARKRGDIDNAIVHFKEALRLSDSLEMNDVHPLLNLGDIYVENEYHELALNYYRDAYAMAQDAQLMENIPDAGLSLSKWYFKNGDFQLSLMYGKEALKAAKRLDTREKLMLVNEQLAKNYEKLGEYKKALYYFKEYKNEQDSFYNQEKIKFFAELELKYAGKKREAENLFLKKEQQKNNTIIEQQRIIFIIGSILFLMLAIGLRALWRKNKQKQEYNDLLERQVRERTSNLKESNDQLLTANQELEQFAYITSHDLKEPLRNIASFSSLLSRKIDKRQYSELPEYLQYIYSSTHQMNSLIEDILAYSKLGIDENAEEVSLENLVEQAKHDLRQTIEEKNANIILSIDQSPGASSSVFLPSRLSMVFKNLIENGIKYNKNESPRVEINYAKHESNHVIRVKDNGFGIEEEYHDLVFEMFKRLHNRTTYQGSGIGLAICRKISHSFGGTLNIISSNEKGTTFELSLPISNHQVKQNQLVLADQ